MFVQISKDEYALELNKKAWYQTNNIIMTVIFLYAPFSILDFIYAPDYWLPFFVARLFVIAVIYGLYSFFNTQKYDYRILLHISFILLAVIQAVLCNLVNIQVDTIYFLAFSVIILFFNLMAVWEPIHSIIQSLVAVLLLAVFFNTLNIYSLDMVVSSGGTYFFIVALFSCFVTASRYKVIEREIKSQMVIARSNEQLTVQNHDIVQKNNIIDMQYEKLRRLDEQKNAFIYMAGHDLKNLIGSIVMSSGMIKDEDYRLSQDQKECVNYIEQSAERMQYLLNKLMNLKDVESTEIKFDMEVFDINQEVRTVFKGLVDIAAMKNIHLVDEILKLPLNVRLDRVFTGQVFQNLLSNSIKFSQTNNNIRVATSLQRQKFVLEIIDEGLPIGQEELDLMFNKLKTLNDAGASHTLTESRLGLGLSIAKLVCQELGGDVFYRSDENGNYFRVEFNVIS